MILFSCFFLPFAGSNVVGKNWVCLGVHSVPLPLFFTSSVLPFYLFSLAPSYSSTGYPRAKVVSLLPLQSLNQSLFLSLLHSLSFTLSSAVCHPSFIFQFLTCFLSISPFHLRPLFLVYLSSSPPLLPFSFSTHSPPPQVSLPPFSPPLYPCPLRTFLLSTSSGFPPLPILIPIPPLHSVSSFSTRLLHPSSFYTLIQLGT